MSRSKNPPSPLLISSRVLVLSAFNAAAAFTSIALASSAVPNLPCAKAVGETITTATHAAAIINVRAMDFLPVGTCGRRRHPPEQNADAGGIRKTGLG